MKSFQSPVTGLLKFRGKHLGVPDSAFIFYFEQLKDVFLGKMVREIFISEIFSLGYTFRPFFFSPILFDF